VAFSWSAFRERDEMLRPCSYAASLWTVFKQYSVVWFGIFRDGGSRGIRRSKIGRRAFSDDIALPLIKGWSFEEVEYHGHVP